ncbi:unnamed protein product [Ilex paraguariensis]|uniref:B box-type domain-containing protein n=1 Tax=Ilex paraguariensis TaxID=185542 RepID=A0ABC8UJQ8_9AQUA
MKKCELCNSIARIYCDSDQASLCWDCDAKVHTANFLVAKHLRTLLCHACQSPTPWTSSGPKLGPTVSVCEACANASSSHISDGDHDLEDDIEEYEDNENEDDDSDQISDEDDGDNQVVPLSSTPLAPPLLSSSSSRFVMLLFYSVYFLKKIDHTRLMSIDQLMHMAIMLKQNSSKPFIVQQCLIACDHDSHLRISLSKLEE